MHLRMNGRGSVEDLIREKDPWDAVQLYGCPKALQTTFHTPNKCMLFVITPGHSRYAPKTDPDMDLARPATHNTNAPRFAPMVTVQE